MKVTLYGRTRQADLGFLPGFLNEAANGSAVEQLDRNYPHGGGWNPLTGFKLNPETAELLFPGDPPLRPVAQIEFRDELIYVYPASFVVVVGADAHWQVARMD